MFENLKEELEPDCPNSARVGPTRWTVRARSLQSVKEIITPIIWLDFWDEALDAAHDLGNRVRLGGMRASTSTYKYLFYWYLDNVN